MQNTLNRLHEKEGYINDLKSVEKLLLALLDLLVRFMRNQPSFLFSYFLWYLREWKSSLSVLEDIMI